ncbi:hypothetical protein PTSG_11589 [Salpingoeca rosetta]|uniref:Uncharacterized protein n=1 Tax=Salpingoeca rosetta (strain ATCC 50818 / BSB-021) TaxID=946362 RepID=F2TWK6_SALR5|nr:uncharacterized protein PTSG_11589 [Salpingoeca rosetta]EGD72452.1 hypothetical protein PTSG_11589 [Salpingoeca rosetta]|eukprot:XP_004999021.1 hypothetical protein PTSG_11589 [Salpingoeca rosetta]
MKGKRGDGGVVVGGGGQHLRDREGGDSTAVTVAIPEEEEEEHSHDRHSGTNDDNARARSTDTVSTSQQGNGVQANTDTKDSKTAATAATAATATAKKSKAPEPPVFPFLAAYPWLQYNSIMVVVVACALMFTGFHMVRDQLQDVCQPTVTKASFFLDEAVGDGHWFRTSWNPNSCLLHPYTSKRSDVASCLNGDTAVFIGDSRVRQLFQALVQTFDPTFEVTTEQRHQDIHFTDNTTNVSLSFLWQPEIISADVQRLYSDWAAALQSGTRAPAMIVHSAGLWAMKRGEPIDTLVQQAEQLRDAMSAIPRATPIYWLPISRVDESLLWESRKAITNNVIHHFNARCKHVFADSRNTQGDLVVFADRILDVAADFTETEDGLHFESSLPKQVHLLLNHLCHGVRTLRRGSRTCCAAPERTAPHQWLVLATFAGCCAFVALLVLNRRRIADKLADPPRSTRFFDSFAQAAAAVKKTHPRLFVVSTVALCMIFIFIADRTGVFMVAAKEFQWSHFSLGCLAILALGLVSVRTSAKAGALNRDQTDEWKGWMQLCFLLYHYTGASQVLSIYVFIRVCVAAYIFMTGFGHYIYFTQKKEFTWHRITMVVLRVNIFTLFLSMTMNRTYQFYYFVPLSTFWFLMVCLVMWALRGLDGRLALVKPFTLIAIAALLYYETEDGATPVFDFIFDHKLLAPSSCVCL